MLAEYRLTWRQALTHGLRAGGLGSAVLLAAVAVAPGARDLPDLAWVLILAPLPSGLLCGTALRSWAGTTLDGAGVRSRSYGPYAFAPWSRVVDVRAERRRGRTLVAVYLADGAVLRLRVPYDGGPLDRDPRFEQKLVMIAQLWEEHRYGCASADAGLRP
ncbi:hypothetical protein [Plantactinospora sonchi]|uniref:PH domain-containing protein n=1 Tax=Plantactinospora sonchi TaxID=1544735 RepID=A0ABU7S2C2_9ACTN